MSSENGIEEYHRYVEDLEQQIETLEQHGLDVRQLIQRSPTKMALLIVGESKTEIRCHKALLGFYSDFFDRLCYGSFLEGQSNSFELPEDDPEGIQAFVNWCYDGSLSRTFHHGSSDIDSMELAFKLWILADKLLSAQFAHAAIEQVRKICGPEGSVYLTPKTADYVYANAPEPSGPYRFMRELIYHEGPFEQDPPPADIEEEWRAFLRENEDTGGEIIADQIGFSAEGFPWNNLHDVRFVVRSDAKDSSTWRRGELESDD